MGDFNHVNIQWDTLETTEVEDQQLMCIIQDNFLTQHALEPARVAILLDLVVFEERIR